MRQRLIILAVVLGGLGLGVFSQRAALSRWLFGLTGERMLAGQVRGLGQLAADLTRSGAHLNLQPEVPIQYTGVNPYGINTFLQQEVEPAKRERQIQLIAEAGFRWIRQEFPWYDIEISSKGNFEDCRHPPCRSAWEKYDQIVELSERYGLRIIARLSSPPEWSRAVEDSLSGAGGNARGAFAPPDDFTDFADYAAGVAERYRGRIHYYQIWNEPNGNAEWGYQPVDPEAYTKLLCETYARLKGVDPGIAVLAAALTPTNELGAATETGATNLNDLLFLQRMYAAGAKDCFDIMSAQGYGLFSGPTDRRMRPLVINYGRNQFIRDLMAANGDEHKAIWISEMNWNAVPEGSGIPPTFGQVTDEEQAEYAPLAYQRAQEEWPWVGVNTFWYFKDADDHERGQAKYYFRMADPDFTLRPVYDSLKEYMHRTPVMYPGWFQEDHWAVAWEGEWSTSRAPQATFGLHKTTLQPGASLRFTFAGTQAWLVTARGPEAGALGVSIDGGPVQTVELRADSPEFRYRLPLARRLPDGPHTLVITALSGVQTVDGFIIRRVPDRTGWIALGAGAVLLAGWYFARRGREPGSSG
jgi:hypothetical protein